MFAEPTWQVAHGMRLPAVSPTPTFDDLSGFEARYRRMASPARTSSNGCPPPLVQSGFTSTETRSAGTAVSITGLRCGWRNVLLVCVDRSGPGRGRQSQRGCRSFRFIPFAGTYPYAPEFGRNYGAGFKLRSVAFKNLLAGIRLLARGETNQTDDSRMRQTPHDGQFAEILVERYQDTARLASTREDFGVARIARPCPAPLDIVAQRGQLANCATPDATVQQKLQSQAAARNIGSTRSCSTRRWAYARQASTSSRSSHG